MTTIIVPLGNGNKIVLRSEEVRAIETHTSNKQFFVRLHLDGGLNLANGNGIADDEFLDVGFKSEENRDGYFNDVFGVMENDDESGDAVDGLRSLN